MNNISKAFVIVATKGRAKETYILLNHLAAQTYPIKKIVVVGSEQSDIVGLENHPLFSTQKLVIKTSPVGSCIQRNHGLDQITDDVKDIAPENWFVIFFDDDFRLVANWVENCADLFARDSTVVGMTGRVLADGVHGTGLSENEAQEILANNLADLTQADYAETTGLYGCNMAFRGSFANKARFDENLPLYGWQEDIDYSTRAARDGKIVYAPSCVGVHMGVSNGRTSGVRFGYSQIANPIYLYKKGTMTYKKMMTLMSRNVGANVIRTILMNRKKDFSGRLYGNILALIDLLRKNCHPKNVIKIK